MDKSANQQVGKSTKKRRKRSTEALPSQLPSAAQGEEMPLNSESPPSVPPDGGEGLYARGEWKGLPMWQCKLCPWSTLRSEQEMIEHIEACHMPKPVRWKKVKLPIVDRFGNPM